MRSQPLALNRTINKFGLKLFELCKMFLFFVLFTNILPTHFVCSHFFYKKKPLGGLIQPALNTFKYSNFPQACWFIFRTTLYFPLCMRRLDWTRDKTTPVIECTRLQKFNNVLLWIVWNICECRLDCQTADVTDTGLHSDSGIIDFTPHTSHHAALQMFPPHRTRLCLATEQLLLGHISGICRFLCSNPRGGPWFKWTVSRIEY